MAIDNQLEVMPTGEARIIKIYRNGSALIEFDETGIRLLFTDYQKFARQQAEVSTEEDKKQ